MGQKLDGRRGAVFSVRVSAEERERLEALSLHEGPRSLGPWMLWKALGSPAAVPGPGTTRARVVPTRAGNTRPGAVLPPLPPPSKRVILDLCAGSGAWSEPYKRAGYRVIRVTLPKHDVRTFVSPYAQVWGVLAAPPCTEFSPLRNGTPRDFVGGMACVNACLRLVLQTRPRWWALENPVGQLRVFLGTPRDVFEPCDFGDPWTKRTALWGDFNKPERGPHVRPATSKVRSGRTSAERSETPPGFARAFFKANP